MSAPMGAPLGAAPADTPAIEAEAAARRRLARDWVPLRRAIARITPPEAAWRAESGSLSAQGGLVLVQTLLTVLAARRPEAGVALGRAAALVARAAVPVPDTLAGPLPATPDALADLVFAGLAAPSALAARPGLEAWSSPDAPLPWRVVLLAAPRLGGSAHPAAPGWWLRWLVAECVLSEALDTAPAEAAFALRPDLVLTLASAPA